MLKIKLAILLLSSLFFLSTPISAAEISCPNNGEAMDVQYGDTVNCSIESVADIDIFVIALTEGDFFSASIVPADNCNELDISIRAFDINNNTQASENRNNCTGTRIEFKVDKTGIYTITVSDWRDDDLGGYQVEFQCISGSCISQALLPKQECTASFDGSVFEVPYIEFSEKVFTANFKMISGSPLQFELTIAGEK